MRPNPQVISGMGFMMSRSKLWQYVVRMLVITAIGMAANGAGFAEERAIAAILRSIPSINPAKADERNPYE